MDWDAANKHFLSCYPKEGVGYFKSGVFYPLDNLSLHDDQFEVDETILLLEPDLLVHSHCQPKEGTWHDLREPSFADLEGQLKTGIEWAIVLTDGEECDPPLRWGNPAARPPLEGRPFIHGMYDCLELCRDWFALNRGINLPNIPRHSDWFLNGEDHMTQLHQQWGFKKVEMEDLQPGDVLFYTVRSPVVNHLAIYLGKNDQGEEKVLTHWFGRISGEESIYKWRSHITYAARYSA